MDIAPETLAESVASLVRIPSVNPLHAGPRAAEVGAIGEAAIAHHLARRFSELGATEIVLDEVLDDRPNVYGFFPGRTDRLAVLDVHTDTVTVEHMTDPPFDGRIADGCVWGRGALDTKASMGVILALLDRWQQTRRRPEPTLLVVGSIAEEAGGLLGATGFRRWADDRELEIDQMIVAEPTEMSPIHGHKGATLMRVTVHGQAAHSALPHLGKNAIEAIAPVIVAFEAEHERLQSVPTTSELGTSTVSVTEIQGGSGGNVIPAECSLLVTQRLVPGQDPTVAFDRLARIAADACPLPVTCTPPVPRPDGELGAAAFYQPADTPLARDLASWAGTAPAIAPFGTNALRYVGLARDLAVFGPGQIGDAHQATERVAITDLVRLATVYTTWLAPA